jgi:UDP-N-acetylmuramoyl-tripeptide--D-alanyl-D-alanine ligase
MSLPFMSIWVILFVIIFLLKDLLFRLYVLQLKEYRYDKLKDFFITAEGHKTIFSKKNAIRLIMLIVLVIFTTLSSNWPIRSLIKRIVIFNIFCLVIFIDLLPLLVWRRQHKLKMPDRTNRIILVSLASISLLCLSIVVIDSYYPISFGPWYEQIPQVLSILLWYCLIFQLFLPLLVYVAHGIIFPIARFEKRRILSSAQHKIWSMCNLITIGISWSYGKSSVKMLLSELLASQYDDTHHILTTPWNINTELGISQYLLSKLRDSHHYFICEFGTYKIGESKLIGEIVNQKIGFLTGLNNQHVGLFGSIMNAIEAETEILIRLRENNWTLYANRDDHIVRSVTFSWVRVVKYSLSDTTATVYVSKIIGEPGKYEFILHYQSKEYEFKTDLVGRHNILNLTGVIACCLDQWISYEILYGHVQHLAHQQKTLHISLISLSWKKKSESIRLIDDTYNINQNGVKAWLDLLSEYKGRKIVFIDEIIELGDETIETHHQLWQTLAQYDIDMIYLTGKHYGKYIAQWYEEINNWKIRIKNPNRETLKELSQTPATIIFLGRGAQIWLEGLKKGKMGNSEGLAKGE